jgi:hypothetical protein
LNICSHLFRLVDGASHRGSTLPLDIAARSPAAWEPDVAAMRAVRRDDSGGDAAVAFQLRDGRLVRAL